MSQSRKTTLSDIAGIVNLATDALSGITQIIRTKESSLVENKTVPPKKHKNSKSITSGIEAGFSLQQSNSAKEPSAIREANISRLNGLIGDHLVAKENPLAIKMSLRKNGKIWDKQELSEAIIQANGKIAIMVHGLCLNDLQWNRHNHDHGAALYSDFGILPIYLHYNSGLHISENGQKFSNLLESFIQFSPIPVSMQIITHSMGGLVARSASYYGEKFDCEWVSSLRKLVFLGTPHNGSLLEKGGNWVHEMLGKKAFSKPLSKLANVRSSAITDLRYGYLIDEDWKGQDRFEHSIDNRSPVPLPKNVECYAIATTTYKKSVKLGDHVIGDGLVTINSALGRHKKKEWQLEIPESNQWIGRNMYHMDLLSHPEVYLVLKNWLTE